MLFYYNQHYGRYTKLRTENEVCKHRNSSIITVRAVQVIIKYLKFNQLQPDSFASNTKPEFVLKPG